MVILNEAKPKHEHLDEILEDQLQDIRFSNQVNIIVDLKEILRKFFRPDIDAEIIPRRQLLEEISADIINTIGHYRNYFYKKGKYTTFYILYSKEKCEEILKDEIKKQLDNWNKEDKIMFKFTIPTVENHYLDLYDYECVVRIVALSGGYDIDKAVELLAKNNRMIASFSRALLQDLNAHQTQEEFDEKLNDVIVKIYNAYIL